MSKQEMLVLSTKDRDRLKVLHEVKRKHLTQRAAARQLGISDRWVRKLLVRVKKGGDGGIVHRGRGRRSNRRLPESLRTQTLKLVQAKYSDFGPTLACEYLAKEHEVEVSKETLRQGLIRGGAAAGEAAEGGGGAGVAAAAELSRRVGALGQVGVLVPAPSGRRRAGVGAVADRSPTARRVRHPLHAGSGLAGCRVSLPLLGRTPLGALADGSGGHSSIPPSDCTRILASCRAISRKTHGGTLAFDDRTLVQVVSRLARPRRARALRTRWS